MRKVLIADASEQWRELLGRAMGGEYQIRSCADGRQALAIVEEFHPDVLVMDLMLSGTDGFGVLKALDEGPYKPRIIVTGRYFSQFITSSLERYEVDFLVMKPCTAQCITDRVSEVLAQAEPLRYLDPVDHINAMLVALNAPASQQGFRFLRSGILRLMEDPTQQLTKNLYPAIATEFNTSPANVEKSMRTTVVTAWKRRNNETWRLYFPTTSTGQIPKPTTGQFLARLTDAALSSQRRRA